MEKKKVANLDSDTLYQMGDAMQAQASQLDSAKTEKNEINKGLNKLQNVNEETSDLADEADQLFDKLISVQGNIDSKTKESLLQPIENLNTQETYKIKRTEEIRTYNDWDKYVESYCSYAQNNKLDTEKDPFSTLLSQREYEELQNEINDEFAKKTSIRNSADLKFLAIAIALQVTKSLLFPLIAETRGYGQSFDKNARFACNDKSILDEEKRKRKEFKEKKLSQGYKPDEWIEIIYRTPPFDITKGSPAIGINMEGSYHRIHTLGHDPILGWLFGTSNILTDVITFDTFASYKVARNPMIITPEKVPFVMLLELTIAKIKENLLNLPAAIFAEGVHLKSDEYTKRGLPVPILETFAPEIAGNLYKKQYDALCFSRDLKIVGTSASISMLIDMIIGLTHALYYDKDKDGTKDMFEVRTRKILLISNTIATTSNIVCSTVTKNPQGLDIGGLLVTIMHLFSDTRFILNVKKEFIENKIYEKIEDEIQTIDNNQDKLQDFEYNYYIN